MRLLPLIILFISNMAEENTNIVDKVVDDSTKIIITTKAVKWVLGILVTAVLGILGFAWGLYLTVDGKVDDKFNTLNTTMETNKKEIIEKLEDLEKTKVEQNLNKNHSQDLDIVRLLERTNSRDNRINRNAVRPASISDTTNLPSFGN